MPCPPTLFKVIRIKKILMAKIFSINNYLLLYIFFVFIFFKFLKTKNAISLKLKTFRKVLHMNFIKKFLFLFFLPL